MDSKTLTWSITTCDLQTAIACHFEDAVQLARLKNRLDCEDTEFKLSVDGIRP